MQVWGTQFQVEENEMIKYLVDFKDMTTSIANCDRVTAVLRWDRDMHMGDSWDYQDDDMRIIEG